LAAAITVSAYALRVVDDCADDDDAGALHLAMGMGRAVNTAVALTTVATRALHGIEIPISRKDTLLAGYYHAFLQVCAGQDQDMQLRTHTLPDYCTTVQAKTVAAFEFAAWAGACLASGDEESQQHGRACGTHAGWLIQMLDDIEALWFPAGPSDLDQARLTFPILYGLTLDHPVRPLLVTLATAVLEGKAEPADGARICALLDQMQVRQQLMRHVLDHRDAALAELAAPLAPRGRAILQLWLDWLLRDAERMVYAPASCDPYRSPI
jgi:geranylgeranyl pyrophosphate synthase